MLSHICYLILGVKVELIQEEIKTWQHIRKPFVLRGKFGYATEV